MSRNLKIIFAIFIFIFGMIISYFLFRYNNTNFKPSLAEKIIYHDTIISIRQAEPIKIYKAKTKIQKIRDTVILSYPFIAKLDTIVKKDTLKAEFSFPQNTLSLELFRKPDSIRTERITIYKTIEKEKPWWETPAYILGGVLTGYIIGKNIK